MKLLFRQRFFSWFDSYDIYDEAGNTYFTVKGQFSWGHKLVIFDRFGNELGVVQQRILTFLPAFEIYEQGQYLGSLKKEFAFFTPRYYFDFNGWRVEGNFMEWDYNIVDYSGYPIATISKELFHMTDTYVINVVRPEDALHALMFVLAMDAEKCSRN